MNMHMKIVPKTGAIYAVTKRLDISRDELARRMKVSTTTAWRIDAGKVDPSPAFIAGLMAVSDQPFEELFEIAADDLDAVPA